MCLLEGSEQGREIGACGTQIECEHESMCHKAQTHIAATTTERAAAAPCAKHVKEATAVSAEHNQAAARST